MITQAASTGAAVAKAIDPAAFSPVNTGMLGIVIAILGLLFNHLRLSRKQARADLESDRSGWGELIKALQGQVDRMEKQLKMATDRIETLEEEKQRDHRLIIELLGQLNRSQAAVMIASNNMSPELRRAMDATMEGTKP